MLIDNVKYFFRINRYALREIKNIGIGIEIKRLK